MLHAIELEAKGQELRCLSEKMASHTVNEVECHFVTDWEVDEIRAIFTNTSEVTAISVVLDNDGKCIVPDEVLQEKGFVGVNLVGSIVEDDELVSRITSYETKILEVAQRVNVDGSNTITPTPSEFEQYVEIVDEHIAEATESKADKTYVDEELARVEAEIPSVEGYATTEYVDEQIADVREDIPSLDGYATETYVDNEIERVEGEIPSLDGYATETYVNNRLSAKQDIHKTATVSLTTTWTNNQQTVSVQGVTVTNTVIVSPSPSDVEKYASCGIKCISQSANALTFSCTSVPTETISVGVVIL